MMQVLKQTTLAVCGGCLYVLLELLWRGRSHWAMFLLGGLCFTLIGLLNEILPWEMPLFLQGVVGSIGIVTPLEFVTGCIVNLWLGWGIWDYTNLPCNLLGQICLPFAILWVPVAMAAVLLDDFLRWRWFGEALPHYTLFRWKEEKTL